MARVQKPDHAAIKTAGENEQEVVSVDEIISLYPDQWILLHVITRGSDHRPETGVVIGHWEKSLESDALISETLSEVLKKGDKRPGAYSLFVACKYLSVAEAYDELMIDSGLGYGQSISG